MEVPEHLDLDSLRGSGPQPGEQLQPEDGDSSSSGGAQQPEAAAAPPPAAAEPDPMLVAHLVSMGFSENGSKRAVMATGNKNAEAAMEWVFGHMEDAGEGGRGAAWVLCGWHACDLCTVFGHLKDAGEVVVVVSAG